MKFKVLKGLLCYLVLFGVLGFGVSAIRLCDSRCSVPATERLFEAVLKSDVEGVKTALSEGADVNARNDDFVPLLRIAAENVDNGAEIVRVFLSRAELLVNAIDSCGNTALHAAISCGNVDVVRMLLMNPLTDVNAKGWLQITPLELAVLKGNERIAKVILGRSDLRILDQNAPGSCRVLEFAYQKDYYDIAEMIEREYLLELTCGI